MKRHDSTESSTGGGTPGHRDTDGSTPDAHASRPATSGRVDSSTNEVRPAAPTVTEPLHSDLGPADTDMTQVHVALDDMSTAPSQTAAPDTHTANFQTIHQDYNVPYHLLSLVHRIKNMSVIDLLHIADFVETVAARDVYTLLPYTGSNWFIPSTRECTAEERRWELRYRRSDGLVVALGGRRFAIRALSVLIRLSFIALLGLALWLIFPSPLMTPGGYVWDPVVLVVVSAIVGGLICRILQVPPLAGVLWVSIMWNNVPRWRYLSAGIEDHIPVIASKLALTVILLRAGYSMHIHTIRQHWKQSLLLATMPFACEGVIHSLVAWRVFDYTGSGGTHKTSHHTHWPFLQGMLCSVVSPAVVVPGTLYLQALGYSRTRGPLPLMLSAAGMEVVLGVWCANFILGLIFAHEALAVSIVLGLVQFVGGGLVGVALGYVFHHAVEVVKSEAQRLPHGKYQSNHWKNSLYFGYAIFVTSACVMVFLGYRVNLAAGGCVMTVFFALTVSHLWMTSTTTTTTRADELMRQNKFIAHLLSVTWDEVMLPLLFATLGVNINIRAVFQLDFFYRAAICMVCSTAVRVIVIFLVQFGLGMRVREKLLVCMGYLAKATVQASIGPIAANRVAALIAAAPEGERGQYADMQRYAQYVQDMSALYVIFMAAFASVAIVRGGQLMLTREVKVDAARRSSDGTSASRHEHDHAPHPSPVKPTTTELA